MFNDPNDLARTAEQTSASTSASASAPDSDPNPGADASEVVADAGDFANVRDNPLKNKDTDAADGADGELLTPGGLGKNGVSLSNGRIRELAGDYLDAAATALEETGDVDRVSLERRLREKLVAEGVLPECVEAEFARIMETLTAF